jgi:hypothetical protein
MRIDQVIIQILDGVGIRVITGACADVGTAWEWVTDGCQPESVIRPNCGCLQFLWSAWGWEPTQEYPKKPAPYLSLESDLSSNKPN